MAKRYHGSCLCGSITFEVGGFGDQAANCHCTMCRKFHGAAYGTLVSVSGLRWLSGKELLKDYVGVNGTVRSFCTDCGSSVGFRLKDSSIENIELAISLFNDEIPVKIDAQIYTHYKANWVELQKGLPTHGDGRESDKLA